MSRPLPPHPRRCVRPRLLAALLLLALPACLPLPTVAPNADLPRPTRHLPLEAVETEYVRQPGFDEPTTPDALDRVMTLRYHAPAEAVPEGVVREGAERTVLILSPGIFGGAASFDHLARQLVAALPALEVWAVDRRANALEDRTGLNRALDAGDPAEAVAYYLADDAPFEPVRAEDADYVRQWGLEVHLRDLHVLVEEANARFERVLLGGYSFSGALAGYYAAFRLPDGTSAGRTVGQDYLDGLVLIDGVMGRTGAFDRPGAVALGPFEFLPDAERLAAGEGRPWVGFGGYGPQGLARRSTLNLAAHLDPEGLVPDTVAPYPVTFEAWLGLRYGDRYNVSTEFGATLGRAVNADERGNLPAFLVSGRLAAGSASVAGPAGDGPVSWERGDAPVAPAVLARSWSYRHSDGDEWYFPARLAADVLATDVTLESDPRFLPNREVTLPTLLIGAGRGLVQNGSQLAAYQAERLGFDLTTAIIPGYTHLDLLWADDNPAVALMERWLTSRFRIRGAG